MIHEDINHMGTSGTEFSERATRRLKGRDRTLQKASLLDREQEYKEGILNIHDGQILPFNSDDDWDENGKLRAGAPAYSPLIRHKQVLDLV